MLAELSYLGAGLAYQHELHDAILAHRDGIDFLEIPTDIFLKRLPEWTDDLLAVKRNFTTVAHGTKMSLGDAVGWRLEYLDRLEPFLDVLEPVWFSDHLAVAHVPEVGMLDHGMPIPFTREQAEAIHRNIRTVTQRIARPLLLENIFYQYIFPLKSGFSEPAFIREVVEGADCGFLLDLTNLQINAANFGFDPYAWLDEAPLDRTVEIHVAGSEKRMYGGWSGKWIDTHSQPVPDEVWRLVEYVVARAPVKAVLLERDQNYPPMSDLLEELRIAREILAGTHQASNQGSVPATLTAH